MKHKLPRRGFDLADSFYYNYNRTAKHTTKMYLYYLDRLIFYYILTIQGYFVLKTILAVGQYRYYLTHSCGEIGGLYLPHEY